MTYLAPDRHPPFHERLGFTRAEFLRALPAAIAGGGLFAIGSAFSVVRYGYVPSSWALPFVVVCALVGFAVGLFAIAGITGTASRAIAGAVLPSGRSTPAADDFSREDALLMQRDVAGALASFEAKIAADPLAAAARLRAADLHAANGDPRRAEALYREVQRIPRVAAKDDVYAANRLVDLYDGVLEEPGRAMVELRRIIDRHPATRAAEEARVGLAALRARLHPTGE